PPRCGCPIRIIWLFSALYAGRDGPAAVGPCLMQQVLFRIPGLDVPVYGFGVMLFVVFVVTTWLAGRRAEREGMPRDRVQDLIMWTFLGGLFGARLFYVIQYRDDIQNPFLEFFQIWNGGIVFYGGAVGGAIAAVLIHRRFLRRF